MSSFESKITKGVIPSLFLKKHDKSRDGSPILQVTAARDMPSKNDGTPAKRLKLSDSIVENQYAMYTGSSKLEELKQNAVIRLKEFVVAGTADKAIIHISDMDILHTAAEVVGKIGNPVAWKNDGKSAIPVGCKNVGASPPGKENRNPAKPNSLASGERYVAITTLTPYMNKWTIKGRVVQKGEMRTWNNAKGSGNLFSFTIIDESSDIKVTAFKEDADKFFPVIEKGKCVTISNGVLKPKNKQYNSTQHDYELTLGRNSVVSDAQDEGVPSQIYEFKTIKEMEEFQMEGDRARKVVDFIGIIKSADTEVNTIMIRSQNKEVSKREILLVDDTQKSIKCTLWDNDATEFDSANVNALIAIKGAMLGTYGGRSLSVGKMTDIVYHFKGDERAEQLKSWWASTGGNAEFSAVSGGSQGASRTSEWKYLNEIAPGMIPSDKPTFFTAKATITFLSKDNPAYKGCKGKDGERCMKKVIDEGNGNYRCEKCDISSPDFMYRLILKALLADDTGAQYTTFFGEQGEQLLDMNAADFGEILEKKDEKEIEFERVMMKPIFKEFLFDNRVTIETYQDEPRVRLNTNRMAEINRAQYTNKLLDEIKSYA